MRTAVYARVSTRDKDQHPETQLHALREYAAGRGWTVVKEYVDTRCCHLGMAGRTTSRTGTVGH